MKWLIMLSVMAGLADTKLSVQRLKTLVGDPQIVTTGLLSLDKLQEIQASADAVIEDLRADQKNHTPLRASDIATILWAGYRIQTTDNSATIREQVYSAVYLNLQTSGDSNRTLLVQALQQLGKNRPRVQQMYDAYGRFLETGADRR